VGGSAEQGNASDRAQEVKAAIDIDTHPRGHRCRETGAPMTRVLKRCGRLLAPGLLLATGVVALPAQTTGFAPGGQQIVLLDFAGQALGAPAGIRLLDGGLEVVEHLGQRMLKASSRAMFLVQLPSALPADFTLEFDIVPKMCCNPEDLAFEGTPTINQGDASANVLWHRDHLRIIGGGPSYDRPMPSALAPALPGSLTNVGVRVQGNNIQLYTNGRFLYSLDRQFVRGRVLRVFLGGQNDTDQAVYLARLRIATGAPTTTVAAAPPASVPGQPSTSPAPSAVQPVVAAPPAASQPVPITAPVNPPAPPPTVTSPTATAPLDPTTRPGTNAPVTSPALNGDLLVGTGISDITGPIGEVVMMGYADGNQKAAGLHTRLHARAFIFANRTTNKRVVWVSAELAMLFSAVKQGVLRKLAAKYGTLYTDENVMLSATHTHSGPGGYSHHTIYNISIGGFVRQNYDAIVDGITEAIDQAHNRLAPGSVSMMSHDLIEATMVNRSKVAFMLNAEALAVPPVDEINRDMTLLKIISGGKPTGAIAFHAVHNTSMPNSNLLVSSDHKGYAAYLFEKAFGSVAPFQGYGAFVAAFPNGAEGDMSPNLNTSAVTEFYGPDPNPLVSAQIIGTRQFNAAFGLFNGVQQTDLGSEIDFRHKTMLMPGTVVPSSNFTNGANLKTLCVGAYGMSFMAGAEDGRTGMGSEGAALASDFEKALLDAARVLAVGVLSAFMPAVAPILGPLTGVATAAAGAMMAASSDQCQYPKPILLPTGFMHWSPEILPFQIFRIGSLAIAGIPAEMTMQAGRRLEAAIRAVLLPLGVQRVLLTGLANEYSGYVTTPEEFVSQQYEGASTLYGRLTFDAYREAFQALGVAMSNGQPASSGPPIPDVGAAQIKWAPKVNHDEAPIGESFGQFLMEPSKLGPVARGTTLRTIYRSGAPLNDLRRNDTYVRIERDLGGGNWNLVAWDNLPETVLQWARDSKCPDPNRCYWSTMDVFWTVPQSAVPGSYRIRVFGSWKHGVTGAITPYEGTTSPFIVR
jgi:neutral ceramidase